MGIGGKSGKGGKGSIKGSIKGSKGSSKGTVAPVHKPYLKDSARGKGSSIPSWKEAPRTSWTSDREAVVPKVSFSSKGGKSKSKGKDKGKGKSYESGKGKSYESGKGKGKTKGKGKDKGKDKGKGKRKGAAPKNAQFWVRKMEEENRTVLEGEPLTGTCVLYNWKQGWGFVVPDDVSAVPKQALTKLKQAVKQAEAEGKDVKDPNRIYFRKPDVERDFRIMEDSPVTFQLYFDDRGVGACEVCDPNGGGEEGEEAAVEEEEEAAEE